MIRRVERGLFKHILGVGVAVGRLNQYGVGHAGGRELRLQLGRLEGAANRAGIGCQPRIRDALQVPQMLVSIDEVFWHRLAPPKMCRTLFMVQQDGERVGDITNSPPAARTSATGRWSVSKMGLLTSTRLNVPPSPCCVGFRRPLACEIVGRFLLELTPWERRGIIRSNKQYYGGSSFHGKEKDHSACATEQHAAHVQ